MNRRRAFGGVGAAAAMLVALLAGCGSGGAAGPTAVEVSGAWARPTLPSATEGVVYLSITSPDDDSLVGASVPASVAREASVHESMLLDDSGRMAPMPNMDMGDDRGAGETNRSMPPATVPLEAGKASVFAPGGRHVMLIGLARPIVAGETFPLTLVLEHGGEVSVTVQASTNAP